MKPGIRSIGLFLPLLLAGCVHKTTQAKNQPPLAPPIEDTPLPKPDTAPANLPPPVISVPQTEKPEAAPTPSKPIPPPPTPPKHTRKQKSSQSAPAPTEQASVATPEVSAIGHLTSGDSGDRRDQTITLISDTERGLNGINRKLNDQEQKTSGQIREFLKQARTALGTNDVDGAYTLAMKAKVLLGELSQ